MGTANSKPNASAIEEVKNLEPLNQKEIEALRTSWNAIKNHEQVGISTMIRIFQVHKDIKNKWIFATNLETEAEMLSNSQLRYHAGKIVDVLGKIVLKVINCSDIEKFSIDEFELIRLGRNHFHYGVKRENFFLFEESLLFSLKKHSGSNVTFNARMERAWHKLFWLISNQISDGIELEERENLCLESHESNNID